MRIAIVAPHPAPLAIGGAENLFWGLQRAFGEAGHDCEIIGHISPERSLVEVLTSYLTASAIDVGAYDCVISGKYPSWMVRHPDHRLYLLHRLRGLYDAYSGPALPPALANLPAVAALRPGGPLAPQTTDASVVMRSVEAILATGESGLPAGAFAYPGPLARELIHALDNSALNSARIRRFASISKTVANRAGYFPAAAGVSVLYPPPHRLDYSCGGADYFFTSSRLDGPKRIALLIEAIRLTSLDVPLLIAGTGSERQRLEELACGDPRIRFLGFVPDSEMPRYYRDAIAVPFVPFDEDYGLVTLEAMKSGKPVLTTRDAGGPCEFVQNGRTGLVCEPTPQAIAAGMIRLATHRENAATMGRHAAAHVADVTWEGVVNGLLGSKFAGKRSSARRRRKIVVATTLPIFPPQGGGQARVFHLYSNLAREMDVSIVSFGNPGEPVTRLEIAPNLTEIRVGKSSDHDRLERRLMTAMAEIPVTDVAMPRLSHLTPMYRTVLQTATRNCDAIVACHPFLIGEIDAVSRGQPLWFEAQDVEFTLKQQAFASVPGHEIILNDVKEVERRCWSRAKFVFGCTQNDLAELERIYGKTRAVVAEVSNGVALDEIAFTSPQARAVARQQLQFSDQTLALFLGSWHPPNLDAIEHILLLARSAPDVRFIIAGSAGIPFMSRDIPDNVELLGPISNAKRAILLAGADVALNPMLSGTGSNLKMLDYFAAGIPVVSTPFGARGLDVLSGQHAVLSAIDAFPQAIRAVTGHTIQREAMIESAYELVLNRYSWETIADGLIETINANRLFEGLPGT